MISGLVLSQKLNTKLPYAAIILFQDIYPQELKKGIEILTHECT